jgi:putative transposase
LAGERARFGYRRLQVLLRREGIIVNHKRIERLYRLDGLAIRRRKRKRVAGERRGRAIVPCAANDQWALDFLSDALASGRRIRVLAVVDTFTREALAMEVDTSLPGVRVARVLEQLVTERGCPTAIVLDNGP